MTLRQLWVRVRALPHDTPLWLAYAADVEKSKVTTSDEIDDLFAQLKPKEG